MSRPYTQQQGLAGGLHLGGVLKVLTLMLGYLLGFI